MTGDVAIVGAGITGLSIAFHLAERDAGRIVVYDRAGIAAGASGVQPGGVRQQWGTRLNISMARDSLRFYRELGERLSPRLDPRFRACGYLFVAEAKATLERLSGEVALQNELGVPSRLVGPEEAAGLAPGLRAEAILGGTWCGEDGYFDRPQGVVEAFGEAARRLGVSIERREAGTVEGAGRLRFTDGAVAEAGAVVVAAGIDTRSLVRPLGVDLPIEAEERRLFYSEPIAERLLEPLVVAPDRRFAAKQLGDGRLLASDLSAEGDPARRRANVRRHVLDLLPHLEFVSLPLLVGGTYDMTPDRQAVVGQVDDGVCVAAGFSGHGFMMAPEVGRAVAALVVGEPAGEAFGALAPDRFERGLLVHETQVV